MVGAHHGDVAETLVGVVSAYDAANASARDGAHANAAEAGLSTVVLLRSGLPDVVQRVFRTASEDPPLLTLARALTASRGWASQRPALLVARPEPTPVLVAMGRFDDADLARLEALRDQLQHVLPRTRYLDHGAVEAACLLLANRLRERFGAAAIETMRFAGVPRGGLIVLGTLAYALGLTRAQLGFDDQRPSSDAPLVVVDDSVISGVRVRQYLAGRPERSVVVACLHAHPEARAALRARDERIVDVVSAHDFHDYAPRAHGAAYTAWRERWQRRADPDCVWIGQPEHVGYPWSEPDVGVWNPVTDQEEPGWSVMPPELCLAHRSTADRGALRCQLQRTPTGCVAAAEHVVHGLFGDDVVIADLAASATYGLEGPAAAIWRTLLETGDEAAAAAAVAAAYDVDPATALQDVHSLVAELRSAGLLAVHEP